MTLDGTLLRIDRVAMASGGDRAYYSGKHKAHGANVQVIADPVGRLVRASPALSGARHDAGAAREHAIPGTLGAAGLTTFADTAYIVPDLPSERRFGVRDRTRVFIFSSVASSRPVKRPSTRRSRS